MIQSSSRDPDTHVVTHTLTDLGDGTTSTLYGKTVQASNIVSAHYVQDSGVQLAACVLFPLGIGDYVWHPCRDLVLVHVRNKKSVVIEIEKEIYFLFCWFHSDLLVVNFGCIMQSHQRICDIVTAIKSYTRATFIHVNFLFVICLTMLLQYISFATCIILFFILFAVHLD